MPFSGSAPNQTYSRSDGTRTGAAVCAQEKAAELNDTAALADLRENDFATAINALWLRNGGNQPSADLPMNSHKFTGMADGTDRADSVNLGQIQDGNLFYAEASGTANAIALATTPSFSASEGTMVLFVAEADSTSTVTVDLNGDGALALQVGGAACIGGEINSGQAHLIVHDGTQWQLVNPARLLDLMALAKTDGNIPVGDGTNWVAESGATARTSLGLGTGDSPQFTAVNIGAASDTTVSRASAGDIQIESNIVYRAGGTDVAIADGGTGASSAASAFANLKQAASDSATGVIEIATAAEIEAASSTALAVTPGRQHAHPGHPKAWANYHMNGTPAINADFGVTSLTDGGTGEPAITVDTAFSSANYGIAGYCSGSTGTSVAYTSQFFDDTKSTTQIALKLRADGVGLIDSVDCAAIFYGDQ